MMTDSMRSSCLCDVDTGNVAGHRQVTGEDVLDSNDSGTQTSSHSYHYQQPAVDPLPDWQLPDISD